MTVQVKSPPIVYKMTNMPMQRLSSFQTPKKKVREQTIMVVGEEEEKFVIQESG